MRRLLFLGLLVLLLFAVLRFSNQDRKTVLEESMVSEEFADTTDNGLIEISGTISKGSSLYAWMLDCGLPAKQVAEILRALCSRLDHRSCKPGERCVALVDSNGYVQRFVYHRQNGVIYTVESDSSGYVVTVSEIPTISLTRRVEGEIMTSLWDAIVGKGESPEIALNLADIFAWEIDFLTDPRPGDKFAIVFEEIWRDDKRVGIGQILAAMYINDGKEHIAIGFPDQDGKMRYYDENGNSVERTFLKSPLSYRRISSYFSGRRFHPILKVYRPHYGVDYAAPKGTPVVSIGDGRVVFAGWNGGFGKYVEIRHNVVYTSCYGHLSKIEKGINRGAHVRQGQVIGYVGSTGLATGPHLDFRIRRFGSYVNPLTIDYPRAEPVPQERMEEFLALGSKMVCALRSSLSFASAVDTGLQSKASHGQSQ